MSNLPSVIWSVIGINKNIQFGIISYLVFHLYCKLCGALITGMKDPVVNVLMLVGVGLGISSVLLIVVCIWCHRKHVKRREEGALPHHVHVCERGARFASVDSVGNSGIDVYHVCPFCISCPLYYTEKSMEYTLEY